MKKRLFATLLASALPFAFVFADTASFSIRSGETLLGPWIVMLPDASSSPVFITPNSGTSSPIEVSSGSVLGALAGLDGEKDEFSMSDVQFYNFGEPYAGGLYVNCLTILSATSSPLCANWQYSINGVAPFQGAGVTLLNSNDTVFLYFGSPRTVSLATTSVATGEQIVVTAQSYDPATNTWVPALGVTIGITQPDPNNPWSPIEIATLSVDTLGQATFMLNTTGTYSVGIKEDYYMPSETLVVVDVASVIVPVPEPAVPQSGGGGGYVHKRLNVDTALAYLTNKQQSDGSFGSPLLSDWSALAFVSAGETTAKTKLREYFLVTTPALSTVTDYERHAMVLISLGIDPYTGTSVDYVSYIVQSFDGTQIGDSSLYNDDIFAIFPLLHAGYTTDDEIIQKTISHIISVQQQNGSWNSSVDMTSAGVQALSLVRSLPNVSTSLASAKSYLQSQQQMDGGFGNSFSTSWALQAIGAFGESPSTWSKNVLDSNDYLATMQQQDGGVELVASPNQTRVWATAYAIPASLGKTWDSLLGVFSKPHVQNMTVGGGGGLAIATTTTPVTTTTTAQSTTTPSTEPAVTPETSQELFIPVKTVVARDVVPETQIKTKSVTQKAQLSQTDTPVKETSFVTESTPTSTVEEQTQTASVATATTPGFFSRMWHAVVSFFQNIF